tara:strand:- start:2799 stop:3035 length:237 start_codon:yes stop_codon:yes gene_type:complete
MVCNGIEKAGSPVVLRAPIRVYGYVDTMLPKIQSQMQTCCAGTYDTNSFAHESHLSVIVDSEQLHTSFGDKPEQLTMV